MLTLETVHEKLHVGMRFNNYKELCKTLDEEVKTSTNSRNAQKKTWKQFFNFEKDGRYSIIITEIYDDIQEKVDGRSKGNNSKYKDIFVPALLQLLKKQDVFWDISIKQLAFALGMVNREYLTLPLNLSIHTIFRKSQELQIENAEFIRGYYFFMQYTYNKIHYIIYSTLDELKKQNLLDYEKTYLKVITDKKGCHSLIVESEEKKEIEKIIAEELKKLKCSNFSKLGGRTKEFWGTVSERIHKKYNWDNYYQIVHIHINKNQLNGIDIPPLQTSINEFVCNELKQDIEKYLLTEETRRIKKLNAKNATLKVGSYKLSSIPKESSNFSQIQSTFIEEFIRQTN